MKSRFHRFVILLGCGAALAATPSVGRALQAEEAQAPAKSASVFTAKPTPPHRDRIVYVLSNYVATGSNVPVVYRYYHGVLTTIGSANRASYLDLRRSGYEDVATALTRFDPAITHR